MIAKHIFEIRKEATIIETLKPAQSRENARKCVMAPIHYRNLHLSPARLLKVKRKIIPGLYFSHPETTFIRAIREFIKIGGASLRTCYWVTGTVDYLRL